MIEVISLLIVLVMSLIITRVATVALTLTGLTRQTAQFQARSALTGAGFTTDESERVVSHPVRRRIILWLMLIGNTGLVLAASLLVVLFADGDGEPVLSQWQQITLLAVGIVLLVLVAKSDRVERMTAAVIERILSRYTDVGRRDYVGLLRLSGDYQVAELNVEEHDWLAGRTLEQLALSREGVLVLGIVRDSGNYIGAPRAETKVNPGDTLLLYGRDEILTDLDERRAGMGGQLRHGEAVAEHARRSQEEEQGEDKQASGASGSGSTRGEAEQATERKS